MIGHVCPFTGHIQPNLLETAKSGLTGHVRPMTRTYPADRTCPALNPDMTCPQVTKYIRGPLLLRTLGPLISSPLHLLRRQSALKMILEPLHRIPSALGDLPALPFVIFKP
jgi:hypothetical protein